MTMDAHEPGIGATITQVAEDAKAYAAAQAALYRETFAMRFRVAKSGLIAGAVAAILLLAVVPALLVGLILSLATLVGPLLATVIVVVATVAIAGGLGWLAYRAISRGLEPIR